MLRALLTPVSWLYLWGLKRKLARAVPERVSVPVICIGNVTTGGTGKTPVAEAIRARITAHGIRAATLSRHMTHTRTPNSLTISDVCEQQKVTPIQHHTTLQPKGTHTAHNHIRCQRQKEGKTKQDHTQPVTAPQRRQRTCHAHTPNSLTRSDV